MSEHPPQQSNITHAELKPYVSDHLSNLKAQRDAILRKYHYADKDIRIFVKDEKVDLKDIDEMKALYREMEEIIRTKEIPETSKYKVAKEIFKEDFLGAEAIEKTFDIHIDEDDIPEIPFSYEDLERAKELGQFFILRVSETDEGEPLTMKKMNEMLSEKFEEGGDGKILFNIYWQEREDFFKKETPTFTWALVSKDVISHSTGKNYLQQIECMIDYLKHFVFKGKEIPSEFQDAISEFEKEKDKIRRLITVDWQNAAEKLEGLIITKLTRQTPVEVMYDVLVYFRNKGERLLENMHTWTSRRDLDGSFVNLGDFDVMGVSVFSNVLSNAGSGLGVAFSRCR